MTLNPIMVVILSYVILKEKITWRKSVGIVIGASGAILLTLTGGSGADDSRLGDLFILINAASYAMYLVLVKSLMKKYAPLTVITWVFTFGSMFVMLFPLTMPEVIATDFAAIPLDIWYIIFFVIIGVTFMTYLLTVFGLKHVSPSVSSAYIYLQPVLVMFFAYVLSAAGIAEDYTGSITWEKIIYMLIIFLGVYITSSSSFAKRRKSVEGA